MFTNPVAAPIVQKAADELGLPIVVEGPEPPKFLRPIATRRWGGFFYYLLWQGAVARRQSRLEADGSSTWSPPDVGIRFVPERHQSVLGPGAHLGTGRRLDPDAAGALPVPQSPGPGRRGGP